MSIGPIRNPLSGLPSLGNTLGNIPNPFDSHKLGPLPFPNLDPKKLSQDALNFVTTLLGFTLAPEVVGIISGYLAYLESQASGKLKQIPEPLRSWLQPYYKTNLDEVWLAEGIDTVHGQNITVDKHIYFVRSMDFRSLSDLHLLCHELEHCRQYPAAGGKTEFFAKYAAQAAARIISKKSIDIHDFIDLEKDAINKADSMRPRLPHAVTPVATVNVKANVGVWNSPYQLDSSRRYLVVPRADRYQYAAGGATTDFHGVGNMDGRALQIPKNPLRLCGVALLIAHKSPGAGIDIRDFPPGVDLQEVYGSPQGSTVSFVITDVPSAHGDNSGSCHVDIFAGD